jgi:hypothetical protein
LQLQVAGWQIKSDYPDSLALDYTSEAFPIVSIEAAEAVNLFNQQNVTSLSYCEKPEQFWTL